MGVAGGAGKALGALRALVRPLALAALVVPAAPSPGPTPSPSSVLGPVYLQVSPELVELRAGLSAELTARLSQRPARATVVNFEVREVDARPRHERFQPLVEVEHCTVPTSTRACSISLVRVRAATVYVLGWIEGSSPDRREGRLANRAPAPLAQADCTVYDGEPLDGTCRRIRDSGSPGADEPDASDVVRVSWTGLPDVVVDCDPAGDQNGDDAISRDPGDRSVTYMCDVLDRGGRPVVGAALNAEIMGGPFDPDGGAFDPADYGYDYARDPKVRRVCTTTYPQGHCQVALSVPGSGPGRAVMCFWPDANGNGAYGTNDVDGGGCTAEAPGEIEGNDASDTVEIDFERPAGPPPPPSYWRL
jgi:hypothetical protein